MESVEDYGYIIDIGVSGTKAFLFKESLKFKHNNAQGMENNLLLILGNSCFVFHA